MRRTWSKSWPHFSSQGSFARRLPVQHSSDARFAPAYFLLLFTIQSWLSLLVLVCRSIFVPRYLPVDLYPEQYTRAYGSTRDSFETFVNKIRNRTLFQISCIPCTGSIRYVGFSICILFMVIRTHFDVKMATCDFVPVGIVMNFAS